MQRINYPRKKRHILRRALLGCVVIGFPLCLGTLIYIAVVVRDIHNIQDMVFSATQIEDIRSLDNPETVIFKSVARNSNDAYNPQTGHFVAPMDGSYILMAKMCSYMTASFQYSGVYVSITVNGIVRGTSHVNHNSPYRTICSHVTVEEVLRKGEHAYVEVYSLNSYSKIDIESENSFYGSRIN